ncbi:hypothetical protein GQ53DRAFT_184571 [Thozetella sp. PMI_491]|nr:hypothetical protein GQ53DRAFT_184571 [Thozetella sp. PMI_491]
MATLRRPNPLWVDYKNLADQEIEGLIIESRHLLDLLTFELSARQESKSRDVKYEDKLRGAAKKIRRWGVPDDFVDSNALGIDVLRVGLAPIKANLATWGRTAYCELIWLASVVTTPAHACLLMTAFTQRDLEKSNRHDKSRFISFLKENESALYCTDLEQLIHGSAAVALHTPSIGTLFDSLDDDSRELLHVIVFLGGNEIAEQLLQRASWDSITWGNNGERMKHHPDLLPVLRDRARYEAAIHRLLEEKLVLHSSDQFGRRFFLVPPSFRQHVEQQQGGSRTWRLEALKTVLHSFPKHRHFEPLYFISIARSMVPALQHTLPSLEDAALVDKLHVSHIFQVAETCLSASIFLDKNWKAEVLARAEKLLSNIARLLARIRLRKLELSRICGNVPHDVDDQLDQLELYLSGSDHRSNACLGELALLHTHLCMDRHELTRAFDIVSRIEPRHSHHVSTLEQILIEEKLLHMGKIRRYQGAFAEAEGYFQQLIKDSPRSGLLGKVMSQLSAVKCEQGNAVSAITLMRAELEALKESCQPMDGINATMLKLSLAEAHLMEALTLQTPESFTSAQTVFGELKQHFRERKKGVLGRVGKMQLFRTLCGIAILSHVQSNPQTAWACWDEALVASRACNWPEGHSDLIIAYSKAELAYRLGRTADGDKLRSYAAGLYQSTGQQYHFVGLGSVWPKMLDGWLGDKRI